jgi:arylsulfatase A-like enzyme
MRQREHSAADGIGWMLVCALVVIGLRAVAPAATGDETLPVDPRPNVVLILTDDQTDYDLRWMPYTKHLIGDQGAEITNFLSPHPLCCPARAELITGEYAQNNGVHHNSGDWGAPNLVDEANNIGRWLQDAGYQTAYVGKFLNGFERGLTKPLAGWDIFNISMKNIYSPYGTVYFNNGNPVTDKHVYTVDYVGQKTVDYIHQFAGPTPFFLWSGQVAPHAMKIDDDAAWQPPIPAPRQIGMFPRALPPLLSKPSFNEADVSDKPSYLVKCKCRTARLVHEFQRRIASLQSVDQQVRNVVRALSDTGELDNTVIMFVSDNGYQLGEHRLRGKNYPYEESLQVPFLIRGPGIPAGVKTDAVMGMVDVAATITDLTGAAPERTPDGRSIMPVITGRASGYGSMLIQAGTGQRPWLWRGVRTGRWTYVEHTSGAIELYDRATDPYEDRNLAGRRPHVQSRLADRLNELKSCSGPACYTPAR